MTTRPPRDAEEAIHLSVDDLASLAERGSRLSLDESAIRHLARCRSCMAAYTDAVRYRAAWLASPELFEGPAERPSSGGGSWRAISVRPLLAAGFLLVIGWGVYYATHQPPFSPPSSQAIAHVLELASASDLVYPGGEAGAASRAAPYRSGDVDGGVGGVQNVLDSLLASYERGSRSHTDLYTLCAALAAGGRMDLAHDYVAEAREDQPESPRFLVLAAIIARHDGDGLEAELLLREARRLAPRDPTVALDLGIVLTEKGAMTEAAPLLREVCRRVPGSTLSVRAERVLQGDASR